MNHLEKKCLAVMREVYRRWWPPGYAAATLEAEARRNAFHLSLVVALAGPSASVCDIGGGWGAFAAGCAMMDLKPVLFDDHQDQGFFQKDDPRHRMPPSLGVAIQDRDVLAQGIDFSPGTVDVFTSFDMIEHLHHSPKKLLRQMVDALRPGGLLLIGAPNCANLRKRLSMLLGLCSWSSMSDWYDTPVFRGHVREPSVQDFRYIARDLGLENVKILGRNWRGYEHRIKTVQVISRYLDHVLRLRPGLCSDLYLLGHKKTS